MCTHSVHGNIFTILNSFKQSLSINTMSLKTYSDLQYFCFFYKNIFILFVITRFAL